MWIASSCLSGCDLDPFNLTHRRIVGDYDLVEWEDGGYCLFETGETGSINSGHVLQLGWNSEAIVFRDEADRPNTARIIAIRAHKVSGSMSIAVLKTRSDLKGISMMAPKDAWDLLR